MVLTPAADSCGFHPGHHAESQAQRDGEVGDGRSVISIRVKALVG